MCFDCYKDNERKLAALREEASWQQVQDMKQQRQQLRPPCATNSKPITPQEVVRLQPPVTRLAAAVASKKNDNVSPSGSNRPSPKPITNPTSKQKAAVTAQANTDIQSLHTIINQLTDKVNSQSLEVKSLTDKLNSVMSLLGIVGNAEPLLATEMENMKSKTVTLSQEFSEIKHSVTEMQKSHDIAEIKQEIKEIKLKGRNADYTDDSKERTTACVKQELAIIVHRTLNDSERRKRNVIVSGLPEGGEHDRRAFLQLCEENLNVKPVVSDNSCIRVGKNQPRKMLVRLESEETAAAVLKAARNLSKSPATAGIYINRDLSKAEAQLAYEVRKRRREKSLQQEPASLSSTAAANLPMHNTTIPQVGYELVATGSASANPDNTVVKSHTDSDIEPTEHSATQSLPANCQPTTDARGRTIFE